MDGHLVAVEVGVVGGADEWVNADGFAFDQNRLKGLNGEAVERGGAVEEDGVPFGDFIEDVPNHGLLFFDEFFGGTHGVHVAHFLEAADDEGLEKDKGHFFGEAALVEFELGADDDDGAAGIIHAFAKEVHAEAAVFSFEHVGEGFEGAIAGAEHGTTVAAVVDEGINGFLKHAFFVADDDFRSFELEETAEAVVAVDDATVEVVEVGGGEASTFEGNEGAQVGRDDRKNLQDHPFGAHACGTESLNELEAFSEFFAGLLGAGIGEAFLEFNFELFEVDHTQDVANAFGAHFGREGFAVLLLGFAVFGFVEELFELEGGIAGINDDVVLVVDDALEHFGGHVHHETESARHAFEEPDVGDGNGQINVTHAFAANTGEGDFDATAVADDAFVLDAFVFAAGALPVLGGAKDAFAEEAAFFRFECTVVDGLGVFDFAAAPGADGVGRGDADGDGVKVHGAFQAECFSEIFCSRCDLCVFHIFSLDMWVFRLAALSGS